MSREYTREEVREEFLEYVRMTVDYWNGPLCEEYNRHERLSGVAFSILTALDGVAGGLPSFAVVPIGTEEDKEVLVSEEENYHPVNEEELRNVIDIAGGLHEEFYHRGRWR